MSDPIIPTRLAYLTEPEPGHVVLNLETGSAFQRFDLSKQQVARLVAEGARYMRGYVEERA